jgi:hypothetical protein
VAVENAGSNVVKGIGIWPPSVSLGALQQQKFWAVVWGPSNTAATWTISPAGYGQITQLDATTALYTAPATITSSQPVTITATSTADHTQSATAQAHFYAPGSGTGDYPLFGSFLNFYRSMPSQLWSEEFGWMRQIDMNTIVLASAGALLPNGSDPTGYSLSAEGLIYPSSLVDPSIRRSVRLRICSTWCSRLRTVRG